MIRPLLVGALLIGIGAVAVTLLRPSPARDAARPDDRPALADRVAVGFEGPGQQTVADRPRDLERRLALLEARLTRETAERQRLEAELAGALAQLAALGGNVADTETASAVESTESVAEPPAEAASASPDPLSAMERALAAAGVDAESAADIKRRHDQLTMNEMYLRDQATREQWLDTPRFAEEMSALDTERVSVRDEIGDEAYDRYLFALGQPNRVRVNDVMMQSPAAEAGLQTGDLIVQYGDIRVFAPDELVAATRNGTVGEMVRLDVLRNGQHVTVDVPRGPLGLRIDGFHEPPPAG